VISWNDITGHERVVGALRRALRDGRPHHAYLLLGPAGVGKMTIATLLSRALACTGGVEEPPCGECPSCIKTAAGTHPDVWTEVPGGKSNTITVDQISEIQRRLTYRRAEAAHRVILIDDAGTMNDQAQNKLLKTLEEPPAGTILVLCALHPSQMLVTVRSRCQKLTLGPVPRDQVIDWLVEHHGADRELARQAAHASRGLPGAAFALLDPEFLAVRRERVDAMCTALAGDRTAIDAVVKEVGWDRQLGADALSLLQELLRDAMTAAATADVPPLHLDADPRAGRMAPLSIEHLAGTIDRVEVAREKLSRNVYAGGLVEELLLHIATRTPYP
jgi:DNA polymerase-3 subunit delta'